MIKGARFGMWNGKKCFFTHYNPDSHEVFSDDLGDSGWVGYDEVVWNVPKTVKGGKARVKH